MPQISFRVRSNALSVLDRIARRLERPLDGDAGRDVVTAMRSSIRKEFAGGYWLRPSGGRSKWKPVLPFGGRSGRSPLGGTSGRLYAAWMGGPGGYERRRSKTVTIGVELPGAAMHRGGSGQDAGRKVTRVRAKKIGAKGLPAMYWRLGMDLGLWVSPRKLLREGVKIHSRPHATRNPALMTQIKRQLRRRWLEP